MRTIAWRSLKDHPVRIVLAVIAVTMGVAFVCATFTLRGMLTDTFGAMAPTPPGDVVVRSVDDGLIPLTVAQDVRTVDGVDSVRPLIAGTAVLVTDGTISGGASPQRPGDQGSVSPSYGVAMGADDPSVHLIDGALPSSADDITLTTGTAERAGLTVGDTTTVVTAGGTTRVDVVGIADVDGFPASATLIGFEPNTATSLFAASGLVTQMSVVIDPGMDPATVRDSIAGVLASDTIEVVTADVLRAESKDLDASLSAYTSAFTGLAVASVLVAMFVIGNTFAMLVRAQSREFAVLRAIGTGRRQLLRSVLGQAVVVGVAGSIAGIACGFGLVTAMRALLDWVGIGVTGAITVSGGTIALSFAVGIIGTILAALLPARRAASTEPVAAMRDAVAAPRPSRARTIVGAIVFAVGLAATALAFGGGQLGQLALVVGVLAAPTGMLLLAPAVLPAVLTVLSAPLAGLGVTGTLATRNAIRSPRRSAATASALLLGMILVAVVSVFVSSASASVRTGLTGELTADVVVQNAYGAVPANLVEAIRSTSGASRVDTLRQATLTADGQAAAVGNLSSGAWEHSLVLPVTDGTLTALADGEIAVQSTLVTERGWALGDTVALANTATGTLVEAPIGAIIDSGSLGSNILIGDALYDTLVPEQSRFTGTVLVTGDAGTLTAITTMTADDPTTIALAADDYVAAILDVFAQIEAIFFAVLAIALIVALLAIAALISLSVSERTREIGMLRAVGVRRREVAVTVVIESALVTLFAALTGLAVGVTVASPLAAVFAGMGIRVLDIPWAQLGLVFVLATVAGIAAAFLPARRAAALPVLTAIRPS